MKKVVTSIVIVVVVVAVVLGFFLSRGTKPSTGTQSDMNAQNSNTQQSQAGSAVATNSITISGFAFSPASITIKKGTTVTWTNQDGAAHTVQETDGKTGPDSTMLANGKSYTFTFAETGTFKYHCSIHPDMTGTVTVTD